MFKQNRKKKQPQPVPKIRKGTVKKYLTDLQFNILQLLKKQLLNPSQTGPHPLIIMCEIFREEFGKSYSRYVKPEQTREGVLDKAKVLNHYRERTDELIREYSKASNTHLDTSMD